MKKYLLLIAVIATFIQTSGQEISCNVSVSASNIEGSSDQIFKSMQRDIYEFLNNRKWTENVFSNQERIECNLFIQLTQQISADEFKGTIQVQARRPVFNSSYSTPVLNIKDEDFHVRYIEFQAMDFDETSNADNLTNILAYYVYMILGYDYDTFSPQGGTLYFQKAQNIVNQSQNADEKGWKSYEKDHNRYWLVNNILNKNYSEFRDFLYTYHRKGLDLLADKTIEGRANIADGLKAIQKIHQKQSSLYLLQSFFDAKSDELVNIFSEGTPQEKSMAIRILTNVNPSNSGKYEKIKMEK